MGIPEMWPAIKEAWTPIDDEHACQQLHGKRIAIDISIWLHEAAAGSARHNGGAVTPHLTLVDYRIRKLQELHIHPVVVFDGPKIDAKQAAAMRKTSPSSAPPPFDTQLMDAMRSAAESTRGSSSSEESLPPPRRISPRTATKRTPARPATVDGKARLPATIQSKVYKEVKQLLAILDVVVVQAPGEAEAQCAHLEMEGLVDGTITKDFDYFLFGGRRMYHFDFALKRARPPTAVLHVEAVAHALDTPVNTVRDDLIAFALLIGNDYATGVGGMGARKAVYYVWQMRDLFMQSADETPAKETTTADRVYELLRALRQYKETHHCHRSCPKALVRFVKMRLTFPACFPDRDIIDLFERPAIVDVYADDVRQLRASDVNVARLTAFKERYMEQAEDKTTATLRKDKKRADKNRKDAHQRRIGEYVTVDGALAVSAIRPINHPASPPPQLTKLNHTADNLRDIMSTPTKQRAAAGGEDAPTSTAASVVKPSLTKPRAKPPTQSTKAAPKRRPKSVPVAKKTTPASQSLDMWVTKAPTSDTAAVKRTAAHLTPIAERHSDAAPARGKRTSSSPL